MIWPFDRAPIGIRPLVLTDSSACARLHRANFAHPWSTEDFESLLSSRATLGWAAASQAALKGFALARQALDEAEILSVAVAAEARQRGLGSSLIAALNSDLAARDVRTVFLEVDESNVAARALYARLGFEQKGLRKAYYRHPDGVTSNALLLRLRL